MSEDDVRIMRSALNGGARSGALQIIAPTTYNFPTSTDAHTVEITLVRFIPTPGWVSGTLTVRASARTLSSTQSFAIVAQPASIAPSEPQTAYSTSTGETVGTISATAPAALPGMVVTALTTGISGGIKILLRIVQTAGGAAMSVTISAELNGRTS